MQSFRIVNTWISGNPTGLGESCKSFFSCKMCFKNSSLLNLSQEYLVLMKKEDFHPDVFQNLACCYFMMGMYKESSEMLDQCMYIKILKKTVEVKKGDYTWCPTEPNFKLNKPKNFEKYILEVEISSKKTNLFVGHKILKLTC